MFKKAAITVYLTVVVLACSWSLFHPHFFRIHDYTHAARIAEMTTALTEGHFPVRWSAHFGFGYGMPLFEFYAPLPFYVGAVLFWLGVDIILTLKFLWLLCSVLTAFGAYWLGKELYGRSGGLIVATALTLAPYRAVNLYVRGSISEAWGIMALPWILLGIVLIYKKQPKGLWVLVVGLVTLFLSHNLMTMLFVPISLLFAGGYALNQWLRKTPVTLVMVRELVTGYLLSVGLGAFYMVPAFLEKDLTKVSTIIGGYFDYTLHFLYLRQFIEPAWEYGGSGWGPDDGISFFLGWGQWLGLILVIVLCGLALLVKYKKSVVTDFKLNLVLQNIRPTSLLQLTKVALSMLLLGLSLFMTVGKSQFIWDAVSFFEFVQFPWRWLGVSIVFLALVIAAGVLLLEKRQWRIIYALSLGAVIIITSWSYFRPESYMNDADGLYYTDPDRIEEHMSEVLKDYIPVQRQISEDRPVQLVEVEPGGEKPPEILINHGHEKLLRLTTSAPTLITFSISDFPGWRAEIDGQPVSTNTTGEGLISVEVPGDGRDHLVGVTFGYTPVRAVSDGISAVSVLLCLYLLVERKRATVTA